MTQDTQAATFTVTHGSQATKAPAFATFGEFEAEAKRRGYDVVLERVWPANTVLDTHTHDFHVWAQVVQGQVSLTCGERSESLQRGDEFTLVANTPHAERYGPEGSVFWAARKTLTSASA
jgi:quercetin dioxygenase-like cupin family protein